MSITGTLASWDTNWQSLIACYKQIKSWSVFKNTEVAIKTTHTLKNAISVLDHWTIAFCPVHIHVRIVIFSSVHIKLILKNSMVIFWISRVCTLIQLYSLACQKTNSANSKYTLLLSILRLNFIERNEIHVSPQDV